MQLAREHWTEIADENGCRSRPLTGAHEQPRSSAVSGGVADNTFDEWRNGHTGGNGYYALPGSTFTNMSAHNPTSLRALWRISVGPDTRGQDAPAPATGIVAPSYPTRTWTPAHKHHLVSQGSTTSARMGASTSLGGRALPHAVSIHTSARMLRSVATPAPSGRTTAATRCTTVSYFAPIVRRPHSSCQQTVTLRIWRVHGHGSAFLRPSISLGTSAFTIRMTIRPRVVKYSMLASYDNMRFLSWDAARAIRQLEDRLCSHRIDTNGW